MKLIRNLLPSRYRSVNFGYMGMWPIYRRTTLLLKLSQLEITLSEGDPMDDHISHGWSKAINPAGICLGWEGCLPGDLPKGGLGSGAGG